MLSRWGQRDCSRSSRHTRVARAPPPPRLSGPVVLLIGCRTALCLMLTPTWAPGRAPGSGIRGSRRPKGCTPFKRSGQESGVRQAPVDCQGGHPPARKPACRPPPGQAHSSSALATASAWGPPCLAAWWRADCTFHAGPGAAPACATCSRESPDEHGVPNPLVTCTGGSQPVWRRLDGHRLGRAGACWHQVWRDRGGLLDPEGHPEVESPQRRVSGEPGVKHH